MGETFILNTNFFQTIILIVTVGVTLWIYFIKKRKETQNAATILSLQIKEIEKNIEYLNSEAIIDGYIQERAVHYSSIIFEENQWNRYSHLLVSKLDTLSFENIDEFFKVAQEVKIQQNLIKTRLYQSMDSKVAYYYQGLYSRLNLVLADTTKQEEEIREKCATEMEMVKGLYSNTPVEIDTYIQTELVNGLQKTLNKYHKLSDGVAFKNLANLK